MIAATRSSRSVAWWSAVTAHPLDPADETVFDAPLEAAVRAFQQRRGLVADGVVGAQTLRALEGARWRLGDRRCC